MTESADTVSRLSVADVFGRVDTDEHAELVGQDPQQTIRARPAAADLAVQSAFARLAELGQNLDERFVATAEIGSGGMGVVHLAEQTSLGRAVALKELNEEMRDDPVAANTLVREAWVLGALSHPNVVPVHDLGLDGQGRPVVVLKRIEGESWLELLADPARVEEQYGVEDVLAWHLEVFASVCNAVSFAHARGILHRDIKPENVMVGRFGEVYLLDWGIAVALRDDESGRVPLAKDVDTLAGTPTYMAPEMLGGKGHTLGVHTDVYLLGATLFHVLTGAPPHPGDDVMQIAQDIAEIDPELPDSVSPALRSICERAIARNPRDRYPAVDFLRAAIVDYLRHRDAELLAEEGEARLAELEALRDAPGDDVEAHRLAMFNLYSEARLGFRLAKRMWPRGDHAEDGIARAAAVMVGYLLGEGDVASAITIAGQIERSLPGELAERLERARHADETQRRRVAALEELGRELDPEIGRRARMFAYAFLATQFVVIEAVGHFWRPFESHPGLIGGTLLSLSGVGLLGLVFRRALLSTELNRRVFAALLVAFVGKLILHVAVALLDHPPWEGHAIMGVIYAVCAATVATFHAPALSIVAVAFGGAALASVVAPELRYLFYAAAGIVMTAVMVFMGRAGRR